jgi:hypothetical protein
MHGMTDVTRFDGVRVSAGEYRPVWLDSLADDVTIEGSAMNGVVQGAAAVRSIVSYIRTLYDSQEFHFAGPYGDDGFLERRPADMRVLRRCCPCGRLVSRGRPRHGGLAETKCGTRFTIRPSLLPSRGMMIRAAV